MSLRRVPQVCAGQVQLGDTGDMGDRLRRLSPLTRPPSRTVGAIGLGPVRWPTIQSVTALPHAPRQCPVLLSSSVISPPGDPLAVAACLSLERYFPAFLSCGRSSHSVQGDAHGQCAACEPTGEDNRRHGESRTDPE